MNQSINPSWLDYFVSSLEQASESGGEILLLIIPAPVSEYGVNSSWNQYVIFYSSFRRRPESREKLRW